jgi:transposase
MGVMREPTPIVIPHLDLVAENARLRAENVQLKAQLAEVLALVQQLRGTIETQQAHIAKLVKMTFGRSGERVEGPTLFDGLEAEPTPLPVAKVIPAPAGELVPKRKGHGRKPNPADLPRKREEIDLAEAEKSCPCCAGVRLKIGETLCERLDYIPSSIFVRVIARPTYACRKCEQAARDPQFAKPAWPIEPVPKSGVGAGLLAQIIVSKYVDHLPLNRQEQIFVRHGWPVSRTRLCDLIAKCATLLDPLYRLMIARVKQSYVIHADDSPVQVLKPDRTAYAWLTLGDAANPYTVFDFTAGRGEQHPAKFLAGYKGFVHADAYSGYNVIHGGTRHLGCWAHVRRKFVDAQEASPAQATKALAFIRTLYAVEREIADTMLKGDDVVALRRTRAGPILKAFGEWLEEEHRTALPKSPFGQAVSYARNQWPTLTRYVEDARFTIDNNVAERDVRPLAVGRRNWLFIGGDGGLPTASVLMSLCASAKRHGLNPWAYFTDLLTQLAGKPADVSHLLPDIWAQRHSTIDKLSRS